MKILVIGGSYGIGKEVVNYFNGTSVSRTEGYDIKSILDREEISTLSLSFDSVLNHAYCGL